MNDPEELILISGYILGFTALITITVLSWKKSNQICIKNERTPICSFKSCAWLAAYYFVVFCIIGGIAQWLEHNSFVLTSTNTAFADLVESYLDTVLTLDALQSARENNVYIRGVLIFIYGTVALVSVYLPIRYFIKKSGSVAAGFLALIAMSVVAHLLISTVLIVVGIIAVLIMARKESRGNRTYFRSDGTAVNVTTSGDGKEVHTWTEHD